MRGIGGLLALIYEAIGTALLVTFATTVWVGAIFAICATALAVFAWSTTPRSP